MESFQTDEPEMQEQLRVAVIGYGLAGSVFHAPLVASTSGMEVAAIVTANPERRAQAQTHFPQALIVNSVDAIVEAADTYDLAVVATPNRFHAPIASQMLQAGIPTVVDKPMATSCDEARGLVSLSEETGVPLTCFQNRRWDGDFLTVRRFLSEDFLGPIARFESRFERWRPTPKAGAWRERGEPGEAGGLLWDLGSHLIDQARVLFGDPVQVYAETPRRRASVEVDDDTFVALTFGSGVTAHLWMGVLARIPGPRYRILGLRGAFEKFGLDPQESELRAGRRPLGPNWGRDEPDHWGHLVTDRDGETIDRREETDAGCYQRFYALVHDAVVRHVPMPVNPRDAMRTIEIIESARESGESRTVVRL